MDRRAFLSGVLTLLAPLAAEAQQERVAQRVGMLSPPEPLRSTPSAVDCESWAGRRREVSAWSTARPKGTTSAGHVEALLVLMSPLFFRHRIEIVTTALKRRLPTVSGSSQFAADGAVSSWSST
jgi:hypothetical protein